MLRSDVRGKRDKDAASVTAEQAVLRFVERNPSAALRHRRLRGLRPFAGPSCATP